jgi:hypothetical protein
MIAVRHLCPKVGQTYLEKADKKPPINKLTFSSTLKIEGPELYLLYVYCAGGYGQLQRGEPSYPAEQAEKHGGIFILIVNICF